MVDPVSFAVQAGFSVLGKLLGGKSKRQRTTPLQAHAASLIKREYPTSRIPTPGTPRPTTPATPRSEELYDYYQMVEKAKIVVNRIDPEKGSRVGKLGVITDSDIKTA